MGYCTSYVIPHYLTSFLIFLFLLVCLFFRSSYSGALKFYWSLPLYKKMNDPLVFSAFIYILFAGLLQNDNTIHFCLGLQIFLGLGFTQSALILTGQELLESQAFCASVIHR